MTQPDEPELDPAVSLALDAAIEASTLQTYTVVGTEILRDRQSFLVMPGTDIAEEVCKMLNEAVAYDRSHRAYVKAHTKKIRLRVLENAIHDPSTVLPRRKVEHPAQWAARAVQDIVEGWL